MLRNLARNAAGAVIVEFAIVLPVLLVMFMGGYVVTDMIACNRKVTIATRALTDIVSRSVSPSLVTATTDESTVAAAAALTLMPHNMQYATETISLLRVCNTTKAYLVWSQTVTQDSTGTIQSSPITPGSQSTPTIVNLPASLLAQDPANSYYPLAPIPTPTSTTNIDICTNTPASGKTPLVGTLGAYLFVGGINYSYHPLFSLPGLFAGLTATPMADQIYMSPRLS